MKTKHTLLAAGAAAAIALSAPSANAIVSHPLVVLNPTGDVHIQQGLPCGAALNETRRIVGGRIDITPSRIDADTTVPLTFFNLSRMELFLEPFSAHLQCMGLEATVEFYEIGLRLAKAVVVPGAPGPAAGQVQFRIPKEDFLIYESVRDNTPFPQPERSYHKPSEDVTGIIFFDERAGRARSVEIHVVLASRMRFRAGCVGNRCLIDETHDGAQNADVRGDFHTPGTDTDSDGVLDVHDNCPLIPNPAQNTIPTPIITPPPDITVNSCQDRDIGTAEATDRCNGRNPVLVTSNAPAKFAIGPNIVTWFGNDGIDPIATAQQIVTVDAVDTTGPTVSCVAVSPPGQAFKVTVADECGGPLTLRLGAFQLSNGEVIQIQETGQPGVRLLPGDGSGIRHFQVGKGEGIVRASDASGNGASAVCR